ncbi:hypothetical protein [Rothia sp. CCM 9419]|uniref:hypothetical protein n=1 Tax=Rothia sp. CCM 9419 TaxID=3402662 RepID=UPI003AED0FF9
MESKKHKELEILLLGAVIWQAFILPAIGSAGTGLLIIIGITRAETALFTNLVVTLRRSQCDNNPL